MKLTVILEQHFIKKGNQYWAEVQCDRKFWDRYLSVFENLVVCARVTEVDELYDTSKLLRSDRPEIQFVSLPNFRGPKQMLIKYNSVKKAIKKAVDQGDCIICRAPSPIILIALNILKRSKKPFATEIVVNPRTAFSKESIDSPLQPIIQSQMIKITKDICMSANGVSYVTKSALQQEYPCKAMQTDDKRFFTESYSTINLNSNSFVMKDWGNNRPDEIVLVHAGTMGDYRKGQLIFIDAVRILLDKAIKCKGIIIGDGPLKEEFEEYAKKKLCDSSLIEFTGWKAGFEQIQPELLRGHFFVFPSASEGLPRSVIEAMASGLICIGTNVDGMSELLYGNGLVKERTSNEFAEKIELFYNNWDEALSYRKECFNKSKEYQSDLLEIRRKRFYIQLRSLTENI